MEKMMKWGTGEGEIVPILKYYLSFSIINFCFVIKYLKKVMMCHKKIV